MRCRGLLAAFLLYLGIGQSCQHVTRSMMRHGCTFVVSSKCLIPHWGPVVGVVESVTCCRESTDNTVLGGVLTLRSARNLNDKDTGTVSGGKGETRDKGRIRTSPRERVSLPTPRVIEPTKAVKGPKMSEILARKDSNGALVEGLDVLQALINKGSKINGKTFSMLLSICTEQIRLGYASLNDARLIMEKCAQCGVVHDEFLFNGMMSACAKAASRGHATLSDGSKVLQDMRNAGCAPDIITYNSLLDICAKAAGFVQIDPGEGGGVPITTMTGYSVLKLIEDEGLEPNVVTFASLMQLCAKCAARGRASVQDGLQVLDRARAASVKPNLRVYNSLMDVVAKSASNGGADTIDGLAALKRLRDEGLRPDTTTYNSLLEVYVHCAARGGASLAEGLQMIKTMKSEGVRRDVITYNTLIDLLAKESQSRGSARIAEGLGLVAVMKADAVKPALKTYSALIDVCAKAAEHGVGDLGDADKILERMKEEGILDLDKVICNSYLNCAKADGSPAALSAADKILDIMPMDQRDSYTYSCMIGLLGKVGEYHRAREMFDEARANLPRLNVYIYNAGMSVQSQQGNYGEVLEIWERMKADHVKEDALTLQHIKVAQESQDAPWK